MILNMGRLHSQLILEESLALLAYDDVTGKPVPDGQTCRGYLTTGVGRNLDTNPLNPEELSAIGHNARKYAITHDQALMLLDNDIGKVCADLDKMLPWWEHLDEIRARALVDLCFNMGVSRLLMFRRFLGNMRIGAYNEAADALKDSLWYSQVKSRGVRLVAMVRTGEDWKV